MVFALVPVGRLAKGTVPALIFDAFKFVKDSPEPSNMVACNVPVDG